MLVNIMLARMVADWFRERELQTAMGLMLSAWPFGMALALVILGPLARPPRGASRSTSPWPRRAWRSALIALAYEEARAERPRRGASTEPRDFHLSVPGACGRWRSARASAGRC